MSKSYVEYSKITFLMRVLNNQLNTKFERAMNMNSSRYELLHYLLDGGLYTQTHLQKLVNIDRAAITRHLKALEEEGYVVREKNPINNRENFVQITKKGKEDTIQCQMDTNHFNNELFEDFTEEELKTFLRYLEKMKNRLEGI